MAKLTVGTTMPDFTFDTPFVKGNTLSDIARKVPGKTALVFLRYYGCTLCQYDIHEFAEHWEEIAAGGGQLLVVLQSDPAGMAAQMERGDLPFDIVCDPEQELYRRFEILPAASKEELLDPADPAFSEKRKGIEACGFTHGAYEGEELQLPAAFVVTPELTVTYAHYGVSATDVPSPQALAELLR